MIQIDSLSKEILGWNKTKNALTWKLLREGYTPHNHPENVKWLDYKYEFVYTLQYLRNSVWEAPCGLLSKGIGHYSEMGYMGIDWRPENNNPVFRCPKDKEDCPFNHEFLRGHKCLKVVNCSFHLSNKGYDYEQSADKIWDERTARKEVSRKEFVETKLKGRDWHCVCVDYDEFSEKWHYRYDPGACAKWKQCTTCCLTGKELDKKKGNVFYDLKITKVIHDNSFFEGQKEVAIIKGKKVFESSVSLTICKAYAKCKKSEILAREKMMRHAELFLRPDTTIEVLNIRSEHRETRDLLQDLSDVKNGIAVIHASDSIINEKKSKKARKEQRQSVSERAKRLIKVVGRDKLNQIFSLYHEGADIEQIREETGISLDYTVKILNIEGLEEYLQPKEAKTEYEQISLF